MDPARVSPQAPGRGQYDRRLPRERRLAEQRERLLAATALVMAHEASPSVSSIVRRAGVGRNTFYEYFDDVRHAVEAAEAAVLRRIDDLLREAETQARTPVERWRSLVRTWLTFADEEPGAMLLVLTVGVRATPSISTGAGLFEAALVRSLETLRSAGVTSPPPGRDRVLAVAAVGEAFARGLARARVARELAENAEPIRPEREPSNREGLERSLVDVAVRLLR
jgi:AcrR family transcriptional regulator